MKTPQLSIFTLLAILTVLLPTAAEDYTPYTRWQPEGATARIGKGIIQDIAAHFGETNASVADVNQDNIVDIRDLVVVASGLDVAIGAAPEPFLLPAATVLLPNYPNPFNPETWIPYRLAIGGDVTLTIYDVHGKAVRQFTPGYQPAGTYQHRSRAAYWDGKNELGEPVASGVYFYTLTAADFSATRKMLIRR